ncbi:MULTISPECIES: globin domain-containing protein [Brevibacterium]|uniref:nitric oxide dioxygenase n=1 Tax=Brevibacterium antiquum CNRZ 918 TaxID=1255637 RepID=A0A2H1KX36_9MICO|nr:MULTISPECIES: globin domain-containing protein [Brevibacterium]SMY04124.1 nitric oxide dioxygenase [Brevibacterium antiquum CNRZ 918]HCG55496.1 hemin transporter [Brevibacterium sp.]
MISQSALSVIRETLPVVGASIGEITPIFYQRMFTARPDLERDLFNRGNQAQGEQQKALAGAIAAYATLLVSDDAPNIDAMMSRISNKHASLGITEDQYAIVYEHLFAAIAEVLGDAATPEVVDAWSEVYWDMADALIRAENSLYSRFEVAPGDVWRELVVTSRTQESPTTISLELAREDGAALPEARPGQYLSLQVTLPDGAQQIRQYSLTRASNRASWSVTIKAEPGRADFGVPAGEVSNFIHDNIFENDTLRCSLPYGDLVVEESEDPLLLVSAGIGCTPIIGALNHLVQAEATRPVTVLHADQSMASHAHRREMAELVKQLPGAQMHHWYEQLGSRAVTETIHEGFIDLGEVSVNPNAQVYLCGPPPFMNAVRRGLAGLDVPAGNVHFEVFGPDTWTAAAEPVPA